MERRKEWLQSKQTGGSNKRDRDDDDGGGSRGRSSSRGSALHPPRQYLPHSMLLHPQRPRWPRQPPQHPPPLLHRWPEGRSKGRRAVAVAARGMQP